MPLHDTYLSLQYSPIKLLLPLLLLSNNNTKPSPHHTMSTSQRPTTLNFITSNAHKLAEVRAILHDISGLELQSRDVPGIDEIQGSIEEIARDKCRRAGAVVSRSSFVVPFRSVCLGILGICCCGVEREVRAWQEGSHPEAGYGYQSGDVRTAGNQKRLSLQKRGLSSSQMEYSGRDCRNSCDAC